MENGDNKSVKREVILWGISLLPLLVFCISCCIIILNSDQNKRTFVEYISINMEEAELYFREKEGWEIEVNREGEELSLMVTTEKGIQYIFREKYIGDDVDKIVQEVIREEEGKTIRGELHISRDTRDFRDILQVTIIPEGVGIVGVKYWIPEFELIDDWGDPAEAELKVMRWITKDKYKGDWEYAEEMMQKLEEFVRLSTNA